VSEQKPEEQLLRYHAIADRSFASFPPTRKMLIGGTPHSHFIEVHNVYGVTVWDVQMAIQMKLEEEVPVKGMHDILQSNDHRKVFPPDCDFMTVMRSLTTMRHLLSFYRIKAMDFVDWEGSGLYVSYDYEPIRRADTSTRAMVY